jgi:hypothetical protein
MNELAASAVRISPHAFIEKWKNAELRERAAAQEQFIDICRLLDEPTPAEADPKGTWYAFEKGALKTGGGDGWADVWKRGCFAWEYKGRGKNLDAAFAQLQRYAIALENPPLLIVSDMERFRIHTNWTNTVQRIYDITLEDLEDDAKRRVLKWAFSETEVEQLKPDKTRQELTEEVASDFAQLAQRLRDKGHDAETVAHFVNRLVFCMFAEDVGLLPNKMFTRMLEASSRNPEEFETHARQLFAAMERGGPVGFEHVAWFNGGLFDDDRTLPLKEEDIKRTLEVARLDWSNIDPAIMGTLFERGLDPGKRAQLGAHYTDRDKIMLIVNPVIVEPLTREWEEKRAEIEKLVQVREASEMQVRTIQTTGQKQLEPLMHEWERTGAQVEDLVEMQKEKEERIRSLRATQTQLKPATHEWKQTGVQIEKLVEVREECVQRIRALQVAQKQLETDRQKVKIGEQERRNRITSLKAKSTRAHTTAESIRDHFLERLRAFRVLDPACGSGNFLYLALRALKDLEHRANLDAEALGLSRRPPRVGPQCVKGIEINPFAAELARVSVWIGEIQWMKRNGFDAARNPILKPLETIECRDALLDVDYTEAVWPLADAIVGNPPFLGNKKMLEVLGERYVTKIRTAFTKRVPSGADLVMYWFQKAWESLASGSAARVGLVGTQAIRRGASRKVLDRIVGNGRIFGAWDDEPWIVEGAAVRVSIVCFDAAQGGPATLDGQPVDRIGSDLVASLETKEPETLDQNEGVCFQGTISGGPFEVPGDKAREWLSLPLNPNGKPNAMVLRPWSNADDLTDRPSDTWIIDFGANMPLEEAVLFQHPFQYLRSAWEHERQRRINDG